VRYSGVMWATGLFCGLQGCFVRYRSVLWATGLFGGMKSCLVVYRLLDGLQGCYCEL
jgi:hypothetical protein